MEIRLALRTHRAIRALLERVRTAELGRAPAGDSSAARRSSRGRRESALLFIWRSGRVPAKLNGRDCQVEWILFVVLQTGAAPMTPEHHLFQAVELGDRLMCEGLLDDMKNCMQSQYRIKLG